MSNINNRVFDVTENKSKDVNSLLITKKAQPRNLISRLFRLNSLLSCLTHWPFSHTWKSINTVMSINEHFANQTTIMCMSCFWSSFQQVRFSSTKEKISITVQDAELNYLTLIAKLYIWKWRRKQLFPSITGFKWKVCLKYEIELCLGCYSNEKGTLMLNWGVLEKLLV